jgi:hypothetical protein
MRGNMTYHSPVLIQIVRYSYLSVSELLPCGTHLGGGEDGRQH